MTSTSTQPFDKPRFEALLTRRFFYAPAFEIYGGIAGLYDYGPPGSALQSNIIHQWRKHFIIEDSMMELDTTIMTPSVVFETSGHVARFADWMVKDELTGDVLRADHLVKGVLGARLEGDKIARGAAANPPPKEEGGKKKKKEVKVENVKLDDALVQEYDEVLAKLDAYSGPDLHNLILKFDIRNPDTGNKVTEPQLFNLMFKSSIGPSGKVPGFLRPETAQSHFLNFPRLLAAANGRLPFASACIGRSFRNEISPRAGLLRVREFNMGEIEHFVDPLDKSHPRFSEIKDQVLRFLPAKTQMEGKTDIVEMTLQDAVHSPEKKIVANETLGYFIARISDFLLNFGIKREKLRFRQHMRDEMAHYATDCWDAEIYLNTYGWVECVGCADRAAYDLTVHSKKTGIPLVVREALKEPVFEDVWTPEWDKKAMGKVLGKDTGVVVNHVSAMNQDELKVLAGELKAGQAILHLPESKSITLPNTLLKVELKTVKTSIREYTPNVIEPSFGLGRILYAVLEHSYWTRENDVERGVLSLPAHIAPTKVLVVPLSSKEEFDPLVKEVSDKLRKLAIFSRIDDSNTSIGKRYARNDELGTPFGVTLDFASVKNRTMTLRERDSTQQLLGPIDDIISLINQLVTSEGKMTWEDAKKDGRFKVYDGVQDVE